MINIKSSKRSNNASLQDPIWIKDGTYEQTEDQIDASLPTEELAEIYFTPTPKVVYWLFFLFLQ